jgi:uncharacterized membrane protein SpoIIM required for sporulation
VNQTQDEFVAARSSDWDELTRLLAKDRGLGRLPGNSISRAASLYRSLCGDLMRARALGYGAELVAYLDALAARAHNNLYAAPPHRWDAIGQFLRGSFARTLRSRGRFFAASAALFFLPFVVGFVGGVQSPAFAAQVVPEEMLKEMETAYAKGFDEGRDAGTNAGMAGFYVYNNIGIAFRCFATGVLFGLGSVFFLVYNGLITGTVFGWVVHTGSGRNILTFTCGHSPFELTAIVIAGAAGLRMGYSLVVTRGLTRWASLREQAPEIAQLVLGAAAMLAIAALIEGFWSPSGVPMQVKWAVGILNTLLVTAYLAWAGRKAVPA